RRRPSVSSTPAATTLGRRPPSSWRSSPGRAACAWTARPSSPRITLAPRFGSRPTRGSTSPSTPVSPHTSAPSRRAPAWWGPSQALRASAPLAGDPRYNERMAERHDRAGPVKAWIEPDRWAFVRAFPLQSAMFGLVTLGAAALALRVHPAFWALALFTWFRHAAAEASLRELWREGMLHPAMVLGGAAAGRIATLVRLEGERGVQDAVVISRIPRRWGKL